MDQSIEYLRSRIENVGNCKDWEIEDKYDINTRLGKFERPFNATNAPKLVAGDIVELQCSETSPPRRPNLDLWDEDDLDGTIRTFCIGPTDTDPGGR